MNRAERRLQKKLLKKKIRPGSQIDVDAQLNAAVQEINNGRFDAAESRLRDLLKVFPDQADAWHLRGVASVQAGHPESAISYIKHALSLRPKFPNAINDLGNIYLKQERLADARGCYEKALTESPTNAVAHNNLGTVLMAQGDHYAAIPCFERAIELKPVYLDAHYNLGSSLSSAGRHAAAVSQFEIVLAHRPKHTAALNNLGLALNELGRAEESIEIFKTVIALEPGNTDARNNLALELQYLGRFSEAIEILLELLDLEPYHARALYNLSQVKKFIGGDPALEAIELALNRPGITDLDRAALCFAAGKAYNDIGLDYDRAFLRFAEGATAKRRQLDYDLAKNVTRILTLGSTTNVPQTIEADTSDPKIVLIVGMPRSGTTLTEQILASHPHVHGAGERHDLERCLKDACGRSGLAFPEGVPRLSAEAHASVGEDYRAALSADAPNATLITDKMPANYRFLGAIVQALPEARIIHVKRTPVDTCVSCFTQLFRGDSQPFTYDLEELGRYYSAYNTLMNHWRSILPIGRMLEVDYEKVVSESESQARRMLDFCGLPWDPVCLDFHRTRRPVHTASATQVRQPLYSTSVGRWTRFRRHLGPLFKALGPLAPEEA